MGEMCLRRFISSVLAEGTDRRIDGAGIVVFGRQNDADCVLMLMKHDGSYDLPKGKLERGERPLAAALRELKEETGVTDIEFPYGHGHIMSDTCVFFVAYSDAVAFIPPTDDHRSEHLTPMWVRADEARRFVDDRMALVLSRARALRTGAHRGIS